MLSERKLYQIRYRRLYSLFRKSSKKNLIANYRLLKSKNSKTKRPLKSRRKKSKLKKKRKTSQKRKQKKAKRPKKVRKKRSKSQIHIESMHCHRCQMTLRTFLAKISASLQTMKISLLQRVGQQNLFKNSFTNSSILISKETSG